MIITTEGTAEDFKLVLRGQPNISGALQIIWIFLLLVVAYFVGRTISFVVVVFSALFLLARVAFLLQRMYGVSSLRVDSESVVLDRKTFGVGRRRSFKRSEIESLGYAREVNAYKSHADAAFTLMAQPLMTPCRFGNGITPSEAATAFEAITSSGSWLGSRIRPLDSLT